MSCYVGDPVGIVRGNIAQRERIITKVVGLAFLGVRLTFRKAVVAEQGEPAAWTTLKATLSSNKVVAEAKQTIVDQVRMEVRQFLGKNVLPIKEVESLLVDWFASLVLPCLTTFLGMVAALVAASRAGKHNTLAEATG